METRMRIVPSRGFTLLEVLIALLIFSLGMLGLAGLMVVSVKTNQSAYQRTQASFLAQSMADRIARTSARSMSTTATTIHPPRRGLSVLLAIRTNSSRATAQSGASN